MKRKRKWPKPNNIPKRVAVDAQFYVKVRTVPPSEIQGCRGEWSTHEDPDDPCMGVIRISNEIPLDAAWMVFREEMQHALIDTQRFLLLDYVRLMAEEEEKDG